MINRIFPENQLNYKKLGSLISPKLKKRFEFGVSIRVITNFLDLFALMGVGIIALYASQIVSNPQKTPSVQLPLFGQVFIDERVVFVVAFVVALLFVIKSIISVNLNNWIGKIIAKMEADAGALILESCLGDSVNPKFRQSIAELQNTITVGLTSMFGNYLLARVIIISEGSLLIILIISFLLVSPIATISLLIYLLLIVIGLNVFVSKKIKKEAKISFESTTKTLQSTHDAFVTHKENIISGNTAEWLGEIVKNKYSSSLSNVRYTNLNGVPRYVIESALIVGIFIFVGFAFISGGIASQAVVIGVFLTGGLRLVASMLPLQAAINTIKHSGETSSSAFDSLISASSEMPNELQEDVITHQSSYEIELKNINFFLANKEILSNVNFSIPKGQKFAIVGPSGAGKSTIFDIILGFKRPTSGQALIRGDLPQQFVKNNPAKIGFVPQKPHVINGTILENLYLSPFPPTNSSDNAFRALETAGLLELIQNLPKGLDTKISSDHSVFSGGEIQRLGLARALVTEPDILLLDEATSALDANTEHKITEVLDNLRGKTTVLIIAHRLSTVQNADQIVYLENGKVIGLGTFLELENSIPNFAKAIKIMMTKSSKK